MQLPLQAFVAAASHYTYTNKEPLVSTHTFTMPPFSPSKEPLTQHQQWQIIGASTQRRQLHLGHMCCGIFSWCKGVKDTYVDKSKLISVRRKKLFSKQQEQIGMISSVDFN